jgi:enoyl-CoA hydratase/carnithine racemase
MSEPEKVIGSTEISVAVANHVALVEIHRPPHNFFDLELIRHLADRFETLDADEDCRAIVLASEGTAFCAGANFANRRAPVAGDSQDATNPLYYEAIRLFACAKPVVAAVHGPAVGGGLGLALVADFRVTCNEARFSANFTRLGFHPGFGLTVTLPRLIGHQKASMLMFTGRRINGADAVAMGLADVLVAQSEVRKEAMRLAEEIAISAPIAVQSTRATLRKNLVAQIREAVVHESREQQRHYATQDFKEGIQAMAERRPPQFQGR